MPKVLTNLDLNKNELQNARIQSLATAPANPVAGLIYYHSIDKTIYLYTGSGWLDLGLYFANKAVLNATTASFTTALKTKLDGIETGANKYTHPSGDGNLHVPATSTTNNGKVLKAGATAGSLSWGNLDDRYYTEPEVDTKLSNKADLVSDTQIISALGLAAEVVSVSEHINLLNATKAFKLSSTAGDEITKAELKTIQGVTSNIQTQLNSKANASSLGTAASKNTGTSAGQIPILDANGKLQAQIVPAIAITDTFVVSTQAAMLALVAQVGDVCVRTDLSKSFILKTAPASTLANWQELLNPESPVQSVNGKTGTVTITKSDVGLGLVANYDIATQAEAEAGTVNISYMTPLRTKQAITALDAVKSVAGKTGAVTLVKGDVGLGNVDNVRQATKAEFTTHAGDSTKHITGGERTSWNSRTKKYTADIGNGTATEFTISHNLGTWDVTASLREAATGEWVLTDIKTVDSNSIKLLFSQPPAASQYKLTVVG